MERKPLEPFYRKRQPTKVPENLSGMLLEICISWEIRSSPDWVERLEAITRQKWWDVETNSQISSARWNDAKQTSKAWSSVIDRLPHYAALVDGLIQPGPLDEVTWVADGLLGDDLRVRLVDCSVALEDLAQRERNWHVPGTDGRDLILIDPSMYIMIPYQTQILETPFIPDSDNGNLAHFLSTDEVNGHILPCQYQWLPADVEVDLDGKARFVFYVNNLNPSEHAEMYGVLEDILSTNFVPMWQKLLTGLKREQIQNKSGEKEDTTETETVPVELKGRKIQVVVRMATTHLTPGENSSHPGGQLHIEGAPHEKIVAVGIYYYSNKNITTTELELGERFITEDTLRHVIPVSTIATIEGRSIVFSNELNHRVLPFEDPDLPGHRKILAMFLVDPGSPIISTARVPCQQRSWYITELFKKVFISILPPEMVYKVVSFLEMPMDLKKAKQARDEFRENRNKNNTITLRVISATTHEFVFRLKPSTQLAKVKRKYAASVGVPPRTIRLLFDGLVMNEEQTPEQLELENEDLLEVHQVQTD